MEGGTRVQAGRFRERTFAGNYFCSCVLRAAMRGELYQDVATGGIGVGAGAVGVGDQPFRRGLIEGGHVDIKGDSEGKAVIALGRAIDHADRKQAARTGLATRYAAMPRAFEWILLDYVHGSFYKNSID